MQTIELSLGEILTLEAELNGFTNPQTGEQVVKGLLSEKINLKVKYYLHKLADICSSEKKTIDGLREELIKKYGKEADGQISIATFIGEGEEQKVNPNFIKFQNEYGELLSEKKEIKYSPINVSDLDGIESSDKLSVIFKLVQDGE